MKNEFEYFLVFKHEDGIANTAVVLDKKIDFDAIRECEISLANELNYDKVAVIFYQLL